MKAFGVQPHQGAQPLATRPLARPTPDCGPAFRDMLAQTLAASPGELRFSAHALERIEGRELTLTAEDMNRISEAVAEIARKGGREALVLTDQLALIVSVPNRTVITALPRDESGERVFTNIDSAAVLPDPAVKG